MWNQKIMAKIAGGIGWALLASQRLMGQVSEPSAWQALFERSEYVNESQEKLLYRIMRPDRMDAKKKYPLVIFLHGAGERGGDNVAQLTHGLKDFARADRRRLNPAFVVAPQCPADQKWVEVPWDGVEHQMPDDPSEPLRLCRELLAELQKELPIDSRRVYLVGLSMGGFGTWDAVGRWPDLFAAAVPVCGGGDDRPEVIARFKSLPLWAFHGDQDTIVPPDRTRKMIEALRTAGGQPRYTEYVGVGHDSWSATFANDELHRWLFEQRR